MFTVGIGAREVVDIAVDIQSPIDIKQGEDTGVTVQVRQSGLNGRSARVELMKRKLGAVSGEVVQETAGGKQTVKRCTHVRHTPVMYSL